MKKDITLYYNAVCKEHSYDNGFCTKCGGYQPADYNESTGSYEIGNGGQMFWFSALVNGDGEHTQIQEAKPDAHGALVSDISLKNPADENYEWKPIGEFKGIFDGQNHTISDFSMTKVNDESIGFFQSLMSDPNETDEAKKATLKNFTLRTIVTTAEAASAVGGVVGTTSDSVIRRVNSNVNIGSGLIYYIGGIVGEINAATSIEESTYSGKIVLDYSFYGVGGIVGFVTDDDTYAGGTKIKECANYGLITYYKVENHGGRGYSGGITGQVALGEEDFILSDCYNYGSVLAEEWKEIYGAISGYCAAKKDGIKNNYYLDTLPVKGFLGEAEIANDEELAKAKTAEQFKSGEEAYLIAMLAGVLLGELSKPVLELGTLIRIPDFSNVFHTVSIFAVGFPPISKFISAIPLALICYVLAFGDFVTSQTLVEEAQDSRSDEYIDFNSSRSNLISGLRNLILAIFAPFPPLAGPLWIGMTVSVAMRYKEGKKAMKSLIGGMSSFRMATFISVILVPIVSFMKPIMGVGSAITLLFQAYVCARIGMDYCKTSTDKSIAGVMAAVLAFKGSGWALLVGFAMNILLSNMEFQKKKLEISETEQN